MQGETIVLAKANIVQFIFNGINAIAIHKDQQIGILLFRLYSSGYE